MRKVLLAILAHPDDETFGIGGTLALYAKHGVDVFLVCATKGEAGTVDPEYMQGYESIAELRESELQCAAKTLGLREVIYLNYLDSGMSNSIDASHPNALINAPRQEVEEKIVSIIRRLKPQVLITFDPFGGYGHPDHIYIHQVVCNAFQKASDPSFDCSDQVTIRVQKFYFYTISKAIMRWLVRLMPLAGLDPARYGQNNDINLRQIAKAVFPIHASIDYSSVKSIRAEASYCYGSQGGKNQNKGAAGLLRGWAHSHEVFTREYPKPVSGHIETDLFEDVIFD